MTHTLHRRGSIKSLRNDYVWQVYPARGINDDNVPERLSRVIDVIVSVGSPNWGDVYTGCTLHRPVEEIKKSLRPGSKLRGVFTGKRALTNFLRAMKEADIGFSVVVSGLFDEVFDACARVGLKPHSVNLSLGIWGKKELLPSDDILDVTTMCGHSLVSPRLVGKLFEDAENSKKSPEEVALLLSKQCPCGVFNHVRAAELVKAHLKKRRENTE